MRLWHQALIPYLPRQQLLGQHRECCALRGNGWGKPHSTVNYVFDYAPILLVGYHNIVINEMIKRGYSVDPLWLDPTYRGKSCEPFFEKELRLGGIPNDEYRNYIYTEHNQAYLEECIHNLKSKGIEIQIAKQEDCNAKIKWW